MLQRVYSNEKYNKKQQLILRNNSRNLRFKVKSLMPIHICNKYNDRNNKISHIQNKKYQYDDNMKQSFWNFSMEQKSQFYIDKQYNKINKEKLFGPLSKKQIQQIKQDKLYYIQERHIDLFNQFVGEKLQKGRKTLGLRYLKELKQQMRTSSLSVLNLKDSKNMNSTQYATIDRTNNITNLQTVRSVNQFNNQNNNITEFKSQSMYFSKNAEQKRKRMKQQLNKKLEMNKLLLDDRIKRNLQNRTQRKMQTLANLSQKSRQLQVRTQKVKKRKENILKRSQLVDFNEKLRLIYCAKKITPK